MSVSALCEAAIRYSDNAAMNLLVKKMGGLKQINSFAHTLHNSTFRQDHGWPEEAYSGGSLNLNDSSTPRDMVNTLRKLTFTKVLPQPQQNSFSHGLRITPLAMLASERAFLKIGSLGIKQEQELFMAQPMILVLFGHPNVRLFLSEFIILVMIKQLLLETMLLPQQQP